MLLAVAVAALGFSLWGYFRPGAVHYRAGADALAAHHAGVAEREWRAGAAADPGYEPCAEALADLCFTLLRYEDAAVWYERAMRLAPNDAMLALRLSKTRHSLHQLGPALAAAKRAAELEPRNGEMLGAYGILLSEHFDKGQAMSVLRRAVQLAPNEEAFQVALAKTEMDTSDYASAERHLTGFLQKHPGNPNACMDMAAIYLQKPRTLENLRATLQYAQTAYAGNPNDPRAFIILGQAYLGLGQVQDALQVYLAGYDRKPSDENVLNGLITCYARLGDTTRRDAVTRIFKQVSSRHNRIEHLKHVVGFNHHDRNAALELSRLHESDNDVRAASALYQGMRGEFPGDPEVTAAADRFAARVQAARERARQASAPKGAVQPR